MLYALFILLLSYVLSSWLINTLFKEVNSKNRSHNLFLHKLFFYHLFLSLVYYTYALFNASDSRNYYRKVIGYMRGPNWSDFYGTSTTFIEWTGYPFIHTLSFTYEAMMVLFSFFGFLGFIFFYKFFSERIFFKNDFLGFSLLSLFFLLPNLHFWSGSFGKGSFIFLGIALIFFSLNSIKKRWLLLFLGAILTYHIRPHIMFVFLISGIIGFAFSNKGINLGLKFIMVTICIGAFVFIYQDVLSMIGIEQGEEFAEGLDLSKRALDLSKATSGIDISGYSIPEMLLTFLYRPLFFDAPGFLGIVVSFENVFLLIITVMFIGKGGLGYLLKGDFLIKTAFLSFLTVSIALAQISGNLGIAIRQKSQVMMLFLFVIISFFDSKEKTAFNFKYKTWLRNKKKSEFVDKQKV